MSVRNARRLQCMPVAFREAGVAVDAVRSRRQLVACRRNQVTEGLGLEIALALHSVGDGLTQVQQVDACDRAKPCRDKTGFTGDAGEYRQCRGRGRLHRGHVVTLRGRDEVGPLRSRGAVLCHHV